MLNTLIPLLGHGRGLLINLVDRFPILSLEVYRRLELVPKPLVSKQINSQGRGGQCMIDGMLFVRDRGRDREESPFLPTPPLTEALRVPVLMVGEDHHPPLDLCMRIGTSIPLPVPVPYCPKTLLMVDQYTSELPERVGQPECKYFMKTGTCKYGATCKYHHPHDRDGSRVQLNFLGLPMRQGEKECPYYMCTGSCKYGATCKFHHSEPTASLPDSGSPVYGVEELSLSPASRSLYPAGLTSWSLERAPYVSGPRLQGPPTYMPVILSPKQSTSSVQAGWSTYHGPVSGPLASPEGKQLGTGTVYSSLQMTDSFSSSHMHGVPSPPGQGSSTAMEHPGLQSQVAAPQREDFPERPDQPECQHYIKTGYCKYGATCRYHHPKERVALSPSCMLSSQGLPLRPGQLTCPFYGRYGICKFGPMCKFNHPPTGSNYNPAAFSSSQLPTISYPKGGSSGALFLSTSEEFSEQVLKPKDQYSKAEEASGFKQQSTEEGSGDTLAAKSPSTSAAAI